MARVKGKRSAKSPAWDLDAFTRVLRLLEKSMREVEEITMFDEPKRVEKKSKVTKGKKDSKSPEIEEEETTREEVELPEARIAALDEELQRAGNAGIAAAAVLTLLDLEGLPKQVRCPISMSCALG